VYESLKTGETVSQAGIFDPAWLTVAPLTCSLVSSPPPLPPLLPCVNDYTVYTYKVCKDGGGRES
jgi:hypothetical protein